MSKNRLLPMIPLFFVIAIDSMGLGILFPVLSSMLIDPSAHFLAHNTPDFTRELIYGIVIGIYMLSWFFGSAMLGDLSDIVGRKKALVVCLLGAFLGYLVSGVAIMLHSITLLIIGRVVAGFTAGSQPIAQAAIVDVSEEEHRARNIGFILLTVSIGFVLGPLIGGVLSDGRFVSWFNFSTPMFFAAIASLFNSALLIFFFKETFTVTRKVKLRVHYAIQIFVEAFKSKRIRALSLILLFYISGWGEYFGFISQFLLRRYHYSSLEVSLFLTVTAIGFSIGFGILVDRLANRYSLQKCVVVCSAIAAIICLITAITYAPWVAWVGTLFAGMTVSVAYSMIITLFSNQVGDDEQGWVMGVTNSVMALSFGVTTFFSGFATELSPAAPIYWAFGGLIIAAIITGFVNLSGNKKEDVSH